MRYISLFSGIEAASVAWIPLGWKPVAFSENDPFPCALLKLHFPNVTNLGDITKIDWKKYEGEIDVVIGGSPVNLSRSPESERDAGNGARVGMCTRADTRERGRMRNAAGGGCAD